jgi:hypothetical protein
MINISVETTSLYIILGGHKMSTLFQKIKQFFSFKNSINAGLDAYIAGKNPQSVAEAERLAQKYLSGGVCRRIV